MHSSYSFSFQHITRSKKETISAFINYMYHFLYLEMKNSILSHAKTQGKLRMEGYYDRKKPFHTTTVTMLRSTCRLAYQATKREQEH
jgi:hypothetical protein